MPISSMPSCILSSPADTMAAAAAYESNNRVEHMRLVIIGAGFAGMYATLSSARLREMSSGSSGELEIVLVWPEPNLVVRPRLYELNPETLPALDRVLEAKDVRFIRGIVEAIDTSARELGVSAIRGASEKFHYDRLVIAAGSRLFRPIISGLAEQAFSVDQLADAIKLDRHLHSLADRPAGAARDTVVVAGGGFTGIEVVTEMPARLLAILGKDAKPRVVVVERSNGIAPDMGTEARPAIENALRKVGVETRLGAGVAASDNSAATSDGKRLESATVNWAAGMRAAPVTAQIPAERDNSGRLLVDRHLSVPSVPGVFAAGDAAKAACGDLGNFALMSCQHATRMGASAGHNAAAELLEVPTRPYHQEAYFTCLDLGAAGAISTRGWERKIELVGEEAKKRKHEINTVCVYPPRAERAAAPGAGRSGAGDRPVEASLRGAALLAGERFLDDPQTGAVGRSGCRSPTRAITAQTIDVHGRLAVT
jgi:NADH dehydrogenase